MKRSLNYARMNVRVGIMSVIAFAILIWVLFFPVRGVSPFSRKIKVIGYYQRVDGLRKNAPVYYRGTEAGSVDSVSIVPEHAEAPLKVIISVEERIVPLLPTDTTLAITARGLLGDVFIDLEPGSSMDDHIKDGDVLATRPYDSVLASMNDISGDAKDALRELKSVLVMAHSKDGSIGRLFRDDALYTELVKTLKEFSQVASRVNDIEKTVNEKLLDKSTKESVNSAVASANRVLKRADDLTAKASDLKWYLGIGAQKYEGLLSSGMAELNIVPNKDKFYRAGLEYFKNASPVGPADYSPTLNGYVGYHGYLGLRVMDSPFFFRGGVKRTSVAAGLDLRLSDLSRYVPLEISADFYKYGQPTAQLDVGGSFAFLKVFRLTGGADDVLNTPFWRAGLSLIYDDEDLTSILIKSKM